MRARRALLYTPGDDQHKIQKTTTMDIDCICLDIEDGVANNRKAQARVVINEALTTLKFGQSERLVRINPVGSGLEIQDLAEVLPAKPDGIVIPKVEYGDQVRWISAQISDVEKVKGWSPGAICIIAQIETARGVVNLQQIASADFRLQGLIFGAEDFAGDTGAIRTQDGWEVFYARSAVVIHAAAYDLEAIDLVFTDLNDIDGLINEARQGMQMGFSGKQIIHPNQVKPVQEVFTPSDEAIAQALRLLDTFNTHQQAGQGAFALDGKMIDAPVIKSAKRILERARAAGKL
jgi:citrate lyase beta subunit